MKFVPVSRPYIPSETNIELKKVLDSRWVTQGPVVDKFEKEISAYINQNHTVMLNSATSGIFSALKSINIKKNDEVIVPDFTFPATGNVVKLLGATPVVVDIDKDTLNMNIDEIDNKITPKTKAIIPVDIFGNPCEIDKIQHSNVDIIEDAACALGSVYKNHHVGNYSLATIFSFHPRKIITTGEGGSVSSNNKEFIENVMKCRNHGLKDGIFEDYGYNFRMSDINASVGLSQLKYINKIIEKRRSIAKLYKETIEDSKIDVKIQMETPHSKHTYQSFVIIINNTSSQYKIIEKMKNHNICTTIGTYSLTSTHLFKGCCPVSEEAYRKSISLPIYFEMKDNDVINVVKNLKKSI